MNGQIDYQAPPPQVPPDVNLPVSSDDKKKMLWIVAGGILGLLAIFFVVANLGKPGDQPTYAPPPSPIVKNGLIALGDHDDTRKTQIFTMSENGSNRKQLTFGPDEHWMPMWSPDGKKIAYVSRAPQSMNIYVMDADGTNKKLLASGGISMGPSWSPDNKKIVYAHADLIPGGQTVALDIWVMNADGTNKIQLTKEVSDDNIPTWSPNGTKIAFTSNRVGNRYQIFVMNADGSNPKALTTAYFDTIIQQDIEQKVPAWSPDGRYIAYWAGVEANVQSVPGVEFPGDVWNVWVMNADGSNQRKLIIGDDPAWSPDSKTILFPACPSFTAPPGCSGGGSLSVGGISPDGSQRRILFQTNGDFGRVSWQPLR